MRKRSTQEIIEVLGVYGNPDLLKKREAEIAAQKKKDQGEKPSKTQQNIEKNISVNRMDAETRQKRRELERDKFEYQKKRDADRIKSDSIKKQETKVKEIGSKIKSPTKEKITSKDKSVTATGKAIVNTTKSAINLGQKAVAGARKIKGRIELNKAKKAGPTVTGDVQSPTKKPPSGGNNVARTAQGSSKKVQGAVSNTIKTSRIGDAVKAGRKVAGSAVKATRQVAGDAIQSGSNVIRRAAGREPNKTVTGNRIRQAVKNTRRTAARPIQAVSDRLKKINVRKEHTSYTQFATFIEDYIHEAEKNSSKKGEKKTIDVMNGKNAVEVNPTIKAEATMSPAQKRKDTNLKKKYDDSDMKQNMIDQYGEEEGLKVYYATIRKQAMKKKKKIKEDVSGLEVQSVSDGLKFREYEFIDVIKNEPMKSPKNNITWTEEVGPDGEGLTPSEQRKGLGMSGSGIRKLKKKMQDKGNFDVKTNLKKKTPDEQHTTTTSGETISELNKYEKMQTAKKRAAVKAVTGGRISKDSSQKIKSQISSERSNPDNKFVSSIRSAENKTNTHLRKIGKKQRDNRTMDNNLFGDTTMNFTKSRHMGNRRNSKAKSKRHFKAGVGFKPSVDASRDATAQLNIKPAPGLNKNSGDAKISRQFNTNKMGKPSTKNIKKGSIPEAKAPVGLMKLAAMVAANNKKRKNALQIQKYIGEGIDSESKKSPNEIKPVELKRIAAISGKFTRFPAGEETEKATERKRLKREKNAKSDVIPESMRGTGDYNKRNPNKVVVNPRVAKFSQPSDPTGKFGAAKMDDEELYKKKQQAKKDAKKTPEQLKRDRQMRNLMRGSSIGRKTPKPKK